MSTFGAEVDQVWPAVTGDSPHLTNFGRKLLKDCRQVQKPIGGYENLGNVIKLSAEFPLEVLHLGDPPANVDLPFHFLLLVVRREQCQSIPAISIAACPDK